MRGNILRAKGWLKVHTPPWLLVAKPETPFFANKFRAKMSQAADNVNNSEHAVPEQYPHKKRPYRLWRCTINMCTRIDYTLFLAPVLIMDKGCRLKGTRAANGNAVHNWYGSHNWSDVIHYLVKVYDFIMNGGCFLKKPTRHILNIAGWIKAFFIWLSFKRYLIDMCILKRQIIK